MRLRVCWHLCGSCVRWREHKELVVGSRRAEEGVEIHHDLRGKLDGARCMVDGQPGIVRENEWVGGFGFATVLASFREASNPCPKALFIIDNEHDVLPPTSELLLEPKCSIAQCRK